MQFIYNEASGASSLTVDSDVYKYLFKARRHKIGDTIEFRNLKDSIVYGYKVVSVSKKDALLQLNSSEEKRSEAKQKLHLIWSIVDSKTIEKQLPYLNELGVDKISFFYAEFSQKNFKLNFDKFEKILINSSQQCGRSSIIQLEMIESLEKYISDHPHTYMLNFSTRNINDIDTIQRLVIGCEGGFSLNERELFSDERVVGLNSNLILRSETAITAAAAKILV